MACLWALFRLDLGLSRSLGTLLSLELAWNIDLPVLTAALPSPSPWVCEHQAPSPGFLEHKRLNRINCVFSRSVEVKFHTVTPHLQVPPHLYPGALQVAPLGP